MIRRIRGRSLVMLASELVVVGLSAADILDGDQREKAVAVLLLFFVLQSISEEMSWETSAGEGSAKVLGEA